MTDKNKHLDCVLSSHKISNEQDLLDKHIERRKEIKEALEIKYGGDLYAPFNSGSYAKNTAVNLKFDFDLMAPFKRNAFNSNGTLKEMFDSVFEFLKEKYHGKEATVRDQKVSTGIEFYADEDGHIVKVDVVPGRELNVDQYKDDKKLNLYVNKKFGTIEQGSDYIRSNIQAAALSDDMKYMIEQIENNSDNIKFYFKINDKHPCEEKDENKYGVKREGVSVPPSPRFG